jgi:ribosomal protein L37E
MTRVLHEKRLFPTPQEFYAEHHKKAERCLQCGKSFMVRPDGTVACGCGEGRALGFEWCSVWVSGSGEVHRCKAVDDDVED